MNLGQLQRLLTANLGGEAATDLHTAEDRLAALNQAYADISLDEEIGQSSVPIAFLSGQASVAFPLTGYMISPDGVTLDGHKLLQINIEDLIQMRGNNESGTPRYYAQDTERALTPIEVYPTPNAGGTLIANVILRPTPLQVDADIPWGGRYETFHGLIAMRAAHILYRQKPANQANMQASRFWLSEYDRERSRLSRMIRREEGGRTTLNIRSPSSTRRRRSGGWRDE